MIRRLNKSHQEVLATLLQASPHYNVYMLGNLAALGIHHQYSEFWGDFSDDKPEILRGTLNRYLTGWSIFGESETDWKGLGRVLDNYPATAARLQDNPGGTDSFLPYLNRYDAARIEEEELMTLARADFRPAAAKPEITARPAQAQDLDALTALYATAGSMQRTRTAVERPLRDGYLWVAEMEGAIRGAALTNAIGGAYAMIGGVYTHPAWRGYGISQAICSALCRNLLADGLTPTLYWVSQDAGHIYKKLGFKTTGTWRSVWLQPRTQMP